MEKTTIILGKIRLEGFLRSKQYLGQDNSVHAASSGFLENVFVGKAGMAAIHHFGKSWDLQR